MNLLKTIGYWKSKHCKEYFNYPDPSTLMNHEYNQDIKKLLIKYLKECKPCNQYRGFSGCRICGTILGTHERTDGTYVWPDKLDHYVEEHNVMLPTEFINHAISILNKSDNLSETINEELLKNNIINEVDKIPGAAGRHIDVFIKTDDTFWLDWYKYL